MDDPQVPFAAPLSAPRWVPVDVVAAMLTALALAAAIAVSGSGTPAGPGWTAARYLAAGVASASLMFRWRFPVANGRTRLPAPALARTGDGAGHGIAGMRERVAVYGGKLVAEPTTSGFRVLARIPTEQAAS